MNQPELMKQCMDTIKSLEADMRDENLDLIDFINDNALEIDTRKNSVVFCSGGPHIELDYIRRQWFAYWGDEISPRFCGPDWICEQIEEMNTQ